MSTAIINNAVESIDNTTITAPLATSVAEIAGETLPS